MLIICQIKLSAQHPVFPHNDSVIISADEISRLSRSVEWLKLVHYRRMVCGGWRSQVEGSDFFISPGGKNDPAAELAATINGLMKGGAEGAYFRCRFPARLKFLRHATKLEFPDAICPDIEEYEKKISPDSVAIVYSSYYLNNPSSIFGHTFFKMKGARMDLMEYGINFSARTENDNFITYTFKGLSGGYPGRYSIVPFHEKAREYNDSENRDIWIYSLNLTADQIDTLKKHIWELLHTHYGYYFLTENCSYHCLSALEPVLPDVELVDGLGKPVTPIDILKVLESRGIVKTIEYRPSLRNVFLNNYSALDSGYRKKLRSAVSDNISDIDLDRLDADFLLLLADYLNFTYPASKLDVNNSDKDATIFEMKRKISIEISSKSSRKDAPEGVDFRKKNIRPPHLIHGTGRVALSTGLDSTSVDPYLQFGYRLLYHDLNDSGSGYPVNSEIEVLNVSVNLYTRETDGKRMVQFNKAALLTITSLNDFSFYQHLPSWSISAGVFRFHDRRCKEADGVVAPGMSLSFGISHIMSGDKTVFSPPSLILSGMVSIDTACAKDFIGPSASLGIGPTFIAKFSITHDLILSLTGTYRYYISSPYDINGGINLRYLFMKNIAIDMFAARSLSYYECRCGFMAYF